MHCMETTSGEARRKRYTTSAAEKWRKSGSKSWPVINMHVNTRHKTSRNFVFSAGKNLPGFASQFANRIRGTAKQLGNAERKNANQKLKRECVCVCACAQVSAHVLVSWPAMQCHVQRTSHFLSHTFLLDFTWSVCTKRHKITLLAFFSQKRTECASHFKWFCTGLVKTLTLTLISPP